METLGIIQARGGSKGVPGKNIRSFAGKPLIAWTIEEALKATRLTRVVVSTDDEEIARIAKEYGAEVPFMRPAELASDSAKSIGLLQHALLWLKEQESYEPDAVVQLKPTNPLRKAQTIDACVEAFSKDESLDSLITVTKASHHPLKTWKFVDDLLVPFVPEDVYGIKESAKAPRQSLPEAYANNSAVHVIRPRTILEKGSSVGTRVGGFVLGREESMNIDDLLDFEIAEFLHRRITS